MNNYTNEDIQSFHQKDRRISWLSIFSSLTKMFQGQSINQEKYNELIKMIVETSYILNKRLYSEYDFPKELTQKPMQQPKRTDGGICPECGAEMVIKTGKKKDGSTWRGQQCPDKNCKHHREYLFLPNLKEIGRANNEDNMQDEANQNEEREFGG